MDIYDGIIACLPVIMSVLIVILLAAVLIRREKSKKKIQRMPGYQKIAQINEIVEPFGFFYVADWDIFSTLRENWQREMGYEALYDRAAPAVHMVMDTLPVYFNYEGRTWLIEFWKGQYGINTGGEVGVYHADEIVPPHRYRYAHFDAVEDEEMLWIKSRLERDDTTIYAYEKQHWWLSGFRVGLFSKPKQLRLFTAITFLQPDMAEAFYQGLVHSPAPRDSYDRCGRKVFVCMNDSRTVSTISRIRRCWAQMWNRLWSALFLGMTAPFSNTADRFLFLYYQLPGCARRMLHFDRKRYRRHRKKRHELS